MKSVLYTFSTDAGTFWIGPAPADRVRLGIDNVELKAYPSAKAAARAVAERKTGWEAWDQSAALAPSALERWKRGSGHRSGRKHAHRKEVDRASEGEASGVEDLTGLEPLNS